jgi:hypothetical protein
MLARLASRSVLLAASLAVMEVHEASGAPDATVIMVASRELEEESDLLAAAVEGQMSDLDVTFRLEWVDRLDPELPSQVAMASALAEQSDAVAVFWSDLRVPDQVFIYIAEPGGGRILARSVKSEGGGDPVKVEAIAVIVRYAVKAMLEGGQIGVEPGQPPPEAPATSPEDEGPTSEPEPAGAPRPGPAGWLEASVAYSLALYSGERKVVHGATVAVSARIRCWLRAFVGYRILESLRFGSASSVMNLELHPILIGLAARWSARTFRLEGGVGLVLDRVRWKVTPLRADLHPTSPTGAWHVGLSPGILAGWEPTPYATLFVSVELDVWLNERSYVVRTASGRETLADPWVVRPVIRAGVSFTFI